MHHIPVNIIFLCRLASPLQQCNPCDHPEMHMKTDKMCSLKLEALILCLFIAVCPCSPCFCVKVIVSLSLCLLVCPSVLRLLLNYSYFYLTKMKSMMMLFFFLFFFFLTQVHTNTILVFHLLRSLPLLVVSMVCNTAPFSHFPQVLVCFGLTGHYADAAL